MTHEGGEAVVLGLALVDLVAGELDALLEALDLLGEVVCARSQSSASVRKVSKGARARAERTDGVDLLAAHAHPPADALGRPRADLVRVLKVGRQDVLELGDRLVVLLDEGGEGADAPADVDRRRRVRDVERREEALQGGVGLELLIDLRDLRAPKVWVSTGSSCETAPPSLDREGRGRRRARTRDAP